MYLLSFFQLLTGYLEPDIEEGVERLPTPLQYFLKFVDEEMIEEITNSSNQYAHEKSGVVLGLTVEETKKYIGVLFLMAIVAMPQKKMYWQKETRYNKVADVFSRNRFYQINQFFHVADNTKFDPTDKLFKIRPFIEKLRNNLQKIPPEEHNSVDETSYHSREDALSNNM